MHLSNHSTCRLCAGSFDNSLLTYIYSGKGKELNLEAMMKQYIPFKILEKDTLPLCVCDSCRMNLKLWDTFITSCKEAQEKLLSVWAKTQSKGNTDACEPNQGALSPQTSNVTKPSVATQEGSSTPRSQLRFQPENPTVKKRSSNYCIARWCNRGNYQGVTLFRLPRERERALIWLVAAERTDLKHMATFHSHYLCGEHFTSSMFTNKACKQLIRKAVPTLFPKPYYARKMALKAGAARVMPTELMGIQLKSILPKTLDNHYVATTGRMTKDTTELNRCADTNISNNTQSPIVVNLSGAQNAVEPVSSSIVQLFTSETSSVLSPANSVIHLISSSSSSHNSQTHSIHPVMLMSSCDTIHQSDGPSESPASVHLYSLGEHGPALQLFNVAESTETSDLGLASESDRTLQVEQREQVPLTQSNEIQRGKIVSEIATGVEQNVEDKIIHFNKDVSVQGKIKNDNNSELGAKMQCESVEYSGMSTVMLNDGSDYVDHTKRQMMELQSYQRVANDQSVVVAQDLLLPPLMDKVEKPLSSFQEQARNLGCDLSHDATQIEEQAVGLFVLSDAGHTLNQGPELSTNHNVLFDLHMEDARDSVNCTYVNQMENIDDLMDLDRLFGNR